MGPVAAAKEPVVLKIIATSELHQRNGVVRAYGADKEAVLFGHQTLSKTFGRQRRLAMIATRGTRPLAISTRHRGRRVGSHLAVLLRRSRPVLNIALRVATDWWLRQPYVRGAVRRSPVRTRTAWSKVANGRSAPCRIPFFLVVPYTYRTSAWKFWLGLGLTVFSFILGESIAFATNNPGGAVVWPDRSGRMDLVNR